MDDPKPTLPVAFASSDDQPDRRYSLRPDEPVSDGIRRVAGGQLADAREELSGASRRELPTAVHATRKRIKRLRAALRLSRDALGQPTYERENAALRRTARQLSAGRDAQVLVDTLDDLGERLGDELPARVTATLRASLEADRADAELSLGGSELDDVVAALDHARDRTPSWSLAHGGFDALSPGLQRIYRRGRKRMRAAADDPTPENLHEWRKRVKDLRHATELVRAARPKRLDRVAKRAHALGDALGDGHDLDMLRAYAETHPEDFDRPDDARTLIAAIDRREGALRDEALELGRKLYDEKPKRFVKQVERGWRKRAADDPRLAR